MTEGDWLVSPRFDAALFVGPAALSLLVLALSPPELFVRDDLPVWAWLVLIPLIDVSHVYASLYRTYFDAGERRRRATLYGVVPASVFVAAAIVYSVDPAWFWTLLAYLAVWHFVRQQYGFLALYRARGGVQARWERRLDTAVLYLSMLYPLAYWHAHLPRKFVWFVEGDLLQIGGARLSGAFGFAYAAAGACYVVKEISGLLRGRPPHVGKNLLLLSTALAWYVGIVHYDSDYAFTVTNVISHGVPYVALVWIYCRRRWHAPANRSWIATLAQPRWLPAFVGMLIAFALLEQTLWEVLVWTDQPGLFGGRNHATTIGDSPLLAFVVALLALPQATHYVLDGFIWKLNDGNADLRRILLGEDARARWTCGKGEHR
jgi:hypothetical protein